MLLRFFLPLLRTYIFFFGVHLDNYLFSFFPLKSWKQLCFFKKALKSLEALEPHVKLVTEKQHIDYHFSGLEDDDADNVDDDGSDDDDDDTYDAPDDGELSFDYGHNDEEQDVVSTSRNSMEVIVHFVFAQQELPTCPLPKWVMICIMCYSLWLYIINIIAFTGNLVDVRICKLGVSGVWFRILDLVYVTCWLWNCRDWTSKYDGKYNHILYLVLHVVPKAWGYFMVVLERTKSSWIYVELEQCTEHSFFWLFSLNLHHLENFSSWRTFYMAVCTWLPYFLSCFSLWSLDTQLFHTLHDFWTSSHCLTICAVGYGGCYISPSCNIRSQKGEKKKLYYFICSVWTTQLHLCMV